MLSLDQIASKYGTDKASYHHHYTKTYEKYFEQIRMKPLRILEIGIYYGHSLKTWIDYFPNATIIGFDINPYSWKSDNPRCITLTGDQNDTSFLNILGKTYGPFDIIIDDGCHIMASQQISMSVLWSFVKPGGIYIIEDLHTCYIPRFKSTGYQITLDFLHQRLNDMYFSGKIGRDGDTICADIKNHLDLMDPKPELNEWERTIEYIHHYRSICFIGKKIID